MKVHFTTQVNIAIGIESLIELVSLVAQVAVRGINRRLAILIVSVVLTVGLERVGVIDDRTVAALWGLKASRKGGRRVRITVTFVMDAAVYIPGISFGLGQDTGHLRFRVVHDSTTEATLIRRACAIGEHGVHSCSGHALKWRLLKKRVQ